MKLVKHTPNEQTAFKANRGTYYKSGNLTAVFNPYRTGEVNRV